MDDAKRFFESIAKEAEARGAGLNFLAAFTAVAIAFDSLCANWERLAKQFKSDPETFDETIRRVRRMLADLDKPHA